MRRKKQKPLQIFDTLKALTFMCQKKQQEKCSFKEKKTPSVVVVDDDYSRKK